MSNPIFDINGVLNVQTKYLSDLAAQGNNNPGTVSNGIKNLQDYLNNLNTAITNSGNATAQLLTKQKEVSDIVNAEAARLDTKRQQINNKTYMAKRMAELNDNYKNRQSYINNIFVIVVIGLLIFIALIKMRNWMPFIPGGIFDLLITILFAVVIIVVIMKVYAMNKRDNLNFDELKLPPMPQDNKFEERRANIKSGNLLGINPGEMCVGQDCCVEGSTTWNDAFQKCYPKVILDTTTPTADPQNDQIWDKNVGNYVNRSACIPSRDKQICSSGASEICIGKTEVCGQGFSCMSSQTPPFTPTEFSHYSLYK
jgi:hypothetical protein